MEVEGMNGFAEFFKDYAEHFAVIGGAACSQWLGEAELEFRQTKDIDVVLVVEETSRAFYERLWQYLHILQHRDITVSGLPAVTPDGLLPLKAKAHLNLMLDRLNGKIVRERDIKKHRKDDVINICEMKFVTGEFSIGAKYAAELENKLSVFKEETQTDRSLHLTMITASGVKRNDYSYLVDSQVRLDDLFC